MSFTLVRDQAASEAVNRAEFERLARSTHKQAFILAYRLTGNSNEAEDLVQDTYLRAFRFFHRYDRGLPFMSWMYRIMTNAHIDGLRRRGRLKTTSLEQGGADGKTTWEIPDLQTCPDRLMMEHSLDEPVQNALLSMTPEFRTAVLLADVEGLSYEEIAEIMQTSVGTVRSRIHRGRKQLRNHLVRHSPGAYGGLSDEL
jgi:RNA polymerase sigma-70 factor, ECF subfamily